MYLCHRHGDEEPLTPTDTAGTFRLGDAEHGPEWIRFDAVVDGQVLRGNRSGCAYYRSFSP